MRWPVQGGTISAVVQRERVAICRLVIGPPEGFDVLTNVYPLFI
jgi:hypothetical protein